jgi:hypothetical protein
LIDECAQTEKTRQGPGAQPATPGGAPAYTATPVNFNGSMYLTRGGALTGVSASKT